MSGLDIEIWSQLSDEFRGRLRLVMSEKPGVNFRIQKGDNVPELLYKLFDRYSELEKEAKAENGEVQS